MEEEEREGWFVGRPRAGVVPLDRDHLQPVGARREARHDGVGREVRPVKRGVHREERREKRRGGSGRVAGPHLPSMPRSLSPVRPRGLSGRQCASKTIVPSKERRLASELLRLFHACAGGVACL